MCSWYGCLPGEYPLLKPSSCPKSDINLRLKFLLIGYDLLTRNGQKNILFCKIQVCEGKRFLSLQVITCINLHTQRLAGTKASFLQLARYKSVVWINKNRLLNKEVLHGISDLTICFFCGQKGYQSGSSLSLKPTERLTNRQGTKELTIRITSEM